MCSKNKAERVYCECFPVYENGAFANLCPILNGGLPNECHEHKKETRRVKALVDAGKRFDEFRGRASNPSARPRVPIPQNIRYAVARRDRYQCKYCYRNKRELERLGIKAHIDHIVPIGRGGSPTDPENLCFACSECNELKNNQIWQFGCREGQVKRSIFDDGFI